MLNKKLINHSKSMKTNKIIIALLCFVTVLNACKKDKDVVMEAPIISGLEVGISNGKVGYVGSDLHLGADIEAASKIKTIKVEIHKESGAGWEFTKVYDEFAGLLNTEFHKHVDIPSTAQTGEYHLHLKVTDMQGKETEVESELELQVNADTQAPTISVTTAPTANQLFNSGQSINISGTIADNVAVGGYLVALVRSDDTQISNSTVIIMDLKYFQDQKQISFNASINAGAQYDKQATPALIQGANAWRSGDYYILIRSWDSSGQTINSQPYPVKITL